MPRIISGYSGGENSLAKMIASLGQSLFGDTLTPSLKREQVEKLQREEYGVDQLAQQMGAGGILDPNKSAEMAVLGGMDPTHLAMFQTYLAGNQYGPRDSRTTNAMAGAGKYKDSANAFDIEEGNKIKINDADNATQRYGYDTQAATSRANNTDDNASIWARFLAEPKPAMNAEGQPVYAPQGDLAKPGSTYSPMPTDPLQVDPIKLVNRYITQAQALGITDPEKQRQYAQVQLSKAVKKGMTVFGADGQPLVEIGGDMDPNGGSVGPLTNANETQVQKDILAAQNFDSILDETSKKIQANPQSVGAVGNIRGYAQSAKIAAQDLAQVLGVTNLDDAWQQVQAEAMAAGVKPETLNFQYDPSLSEIETLYNILAFQGIRTIGGQSGNDASDRDFKIIKQTLGDPNSWFTNARDLGAKMNVVKKYVRMRTNQLRAARGQAPLPETTDPAQAAGAGAETPPVAGAKKAGDGNWYVPDPNRPGSYLQVVP